MSTWVCFYLKRSVESKVSNDTKGKFMTNTDWLTTEIEIPIWQSNYGMFVWYEIIKNPQVSILTPAYFKLYIWLPKNGVSAANPEDMDDLINFWIHRF